MLATFERRAATTAILDAVAALNRDLATTRPWEVAGDPTRAGELDALLDRHHRTTVLIATSLTPIVPDLAAALVAQLTPGPDGVLPPPRPVVERLLATCR